MHTHDHQEMNSIFRDARIRALPWKDLAVPTRWQTAAELGIALPWLLGSWWCAQQGWLIPALALSFVFFLTALRQVHNAFHHATGLPRWADTVVMEVLGVLMLNSMHAVKYNHLQHHRHCLDEHDVEGECARLVWWKALLMGPIFPVRIHLHALRANPRTRRWVQAELGLIACWLGLVFLLPAPFALQYHVVTMAAGQCLAQFFCVWTVHHGCDEHQFIARTLRSPLLNWCSFGMFYHLEHHLFPAVPTCNLGHLAARIDAVAPELGERHVI